MSGRITLTSSTKTSLHERFTKLAAVTRTTSKPASVNARKTAQQVVMRPNVQAALKIKNKSFKQRLGNLNQNKQVNVGTRLQRDNSFNNNKMNFRQNLKSRLGVAPNGGGNGGGIGSRLNNRLRFNQRPVRVQQQTATFKRSQATKLSVNSRIRFNQNKNLTKINRVNRVNNSKIGFKNKLKSPKIKNLKGKVQSAGLRQSFGVKNNKGPLNIKKSLDMDLDQYMSKTKSHLDNDLDSYMAKSKTHLDADLDTYMAQATSQ